MATLHERWATEEAPAVLQSAFFSINEDGTVNLEKVCRHADVDKIAAENQSWVAGRINNDDQIWKLPDRWVFLNTGEVRFQ